MVLLRKPLSELWSVTCHDAELKMTSRSKNSLLGLPLQYDLHHKLITIKFLIITHRDL